MKTIPGLRYNSKNRDWKIALMKGYKTYLTDIFAYTYLSERLATTLQAYLQRCPLRAWFFEESGCEKYSSLSVQKTFHCVVTSAGIKKKIETHWHKGE